MLLCVGDLDCTQLGSSPADSLLYLQSARLKSSARQLYICGLVGCQLGQWGQLGHISFITQQASQGLGFQEQEVGKPTF